MERASKGLTLADGLLADLGGPRTAGLLARLDAVTPWDELAAVVKLLYRNDTAKGGRPNVPVVVMLKVTLMQRWFGLSDPAMEEAVLDRLSFRRFLGLGAADEGIDHSTIALFRERLHDAGLPHPRIRQRRPRLLTSALCRVDTISMSQASRRASSPSPYKLRIHRVFDRTPISYLGLQTIQNAAVMTEPMYELMMALRDKRLDQMMPSLPPIEDWLSLYRNHRRITIGLGDAYPSLLGVDGEAAQSLLDDARAISRESRLNRDALTRAICGELNPRKLSQVIRIAHKEARRDYARHLNELRCFLRDDTYDEEESREFGVALEQSAEIYFYVRVVLPAMLLWQTTPTQLLRMSRGSRGEQAQAVAIERLLRLDPMAIYLREVHRWVNVSDGTIRTQRYDLQNQWRTQGVDSGRISRRQFKQLMGAMIQSTASRVGAYFDLAKGWRKTQLTAADVRGVFDAVAQDRSKRVRGVVDKDIADIQADSWSKQIRRYRDCWNQLLPEVPGPNVS
jgi:hypothetical protein